MGKIRVSLLGSTGIVGQTMVKLLEGHPYIELTKVSASPAKIGQKYCEAVKWVINGEVPEYVCDMELVSTDPSDHRDVDVVLSALPNDVAAKVEPGLVRSGINVISNASPGRMDNGTPLINPEVNWRALEMIRGRGDWLVKNPNCTTAIISLALAPFRDKLRRLFVTTMQSVSGAGYMGVSFLSIEGNVIPYIKGEEEKIEAELGKIMEWGIDVHATSTRVPVKYGHMAIIEAELGVSMGINDAVKAIEEYSSFPQQRGLPTAPPRPLILVKRSDGPQPLRDLDPMAVSIGRLSIKAGYLRMVILGDNIVRGAAGVTILTLETMREMGLI